MRRHVESAAYIRDALIDFQRRAALTAADEKLIVRARDRVMVLAHELDHVEVHVADLRKVAKDAESTLAVLAVHLADHPNPTLLMLAEASLIQLREVSGIVEGT